MNMKDAWKAENYPMKKWNRAWQKALNTPKKQIGCLALLAIVIGVLGIGYIVGLVCKLIALVILGTI